MTGRRGLQILLTAIGGVATFEGARGVIQGADRRTLAYAHLDAFAEALARIRALPAFA